MLLTRFQIFIISVLFFCNTGYSQTFQSFVNRVAGMPDAQRSAIVDSFMSANPHLPYYDNDSTVYFVYRGNVSKVNVPGDANGWGPDSFPMAKLSTTNLWYVKKKFEPDARLDYKFVTNGSNWILDPKNSNQVVGGLGTNSELRMPGYLSAPEIIYNGGIAHGAFVDTSFHSTNLGNTRTVRVYLPPTYSTTSDSFPVMLVHDGLDYVNLAQAKNVLDNLTANNHIRPIIAVFVPAVDRQPEYAGTKINQFSAFIINELMPYIDSRYRTMKNPHFRAVMGASDGGNISLYLAGNHPEVFGNVGAQSSDIISSISSRFQNNPKFDLKLYLDLGTYDIDVLIPLVRNFIPILQSKGYDYLYYEYHEGHSWGNWRAHIDNALEYFFPGSALGIREDKNKPREFGLMQNYPNPFNPTTTLSFVIGHSSLVMLRVYNILGSEVATLVNEMKAPGEYSITWDGSGLASGIYLCRLQAGDLINMKKVLLVR